MSPQLSPTISDRRNPPAKPIRSSARSRASFTPSPVAAKPLLREDLFRVLDAFGVVSRVCADAPVKALSASQ